MFKAMLMAFGMFSVLPVPRNHWDERAVPNVVLFLPFVGGVIGGIWYGVAMTTSILPSSIEVVAILLVPFVLSGFLHVDGYMDTADAMFSRRELAEKRRILKDPHVGAFGVIAFGCLLLVQFAVVQTIVSETKATLAFVFVPIVSRCVVGLLMLTLKPMSETGLMSMFRNETGRRHRIGLLVILLAAVTCTIVVGGVSTAIPLAVVIAGMLVAAWYVYRQFRGFSGDLCGCSLVVGETCGVLCMALI